MLGSLILSFREGFEAVLVIGIILAYLRQTSKERLIKFVYYGTLLGILVAAIGLIGFFVVWMSNQNKNISHSIKSSVDKTSTGLGLFVPAFLSVFRESVELIAFVLTKVSEQASSIALGTGIGIVIAVLLGYVVFKTSVKLNIKIVFKVLGVVLIFVGAELFGEGLAKLLLNTGELLEQGATILFGRVSFIYFLKEDFKRILHKRSYNTVDGLDKISKLSQPVLILKSPI